MGGAVGIPDHDSWWRPVVWCRWPPWLYVCATPVLCLAPSYCSWTQSVQWSSSAGSSHRQRMRRRSRSKRRSFFSTNSLQSKFKVTIILINGAVNNIFHNTVSDVPPRFVRRERPSNASPHPNATISRECIAKNASSVVMRMNKPSSKTPQLAENVLRWCFAGKFASATVETPAWIFYEDSSLLLCNCRKRLPVLFCG